MALFPETMESERLRFEVLHLDRTDLFEFYEHVREGAPGIDEITEYVTWDPHAHPKETRDFVAEAGEAFEDGEAAHYVVRPRDGEDGAGEFAGTAGLDVDWDRHRGTLGVWFRTPFWGRGYSGERAARFFELAFDRLDLELVAVEHHPENEQSRRAIERYVDRFGGRREGTFRNEMVFDGEPRDAVRYSVSREEWAANR